MDGFKFNTVSDVYVGGTLAKQVYIGSTKVWDYKTAPTYTAPTAKTGLVYNRSAQNLLNAGSTSHGTFYYSTDNSNWSTSIPKSTNAGTTAKVYWKLVGDSRHTDIASTAISNITIAKATPVLSTTPTKTADWTYNGSTKNLASGGAMKHSSSDSTAVAGTFTYGTAKNAGTYTATWSFAPTDSTNYNSASGNVGSVTVSQATGTATVTGRTVNYNGSSQDLLTVSGNTGTMHYRVGTSGSWTTTIPSSTNATTATIYYYMDASTNYTARGSSSSPWGNVTGKIKKLSRTVSFSETYVILAPSGTVTKAATVSAGASDGTLSYSVGSSTYARVNSAGKVTATSTEGTTTVTATISEGTNYLSASASYTLYVFADNHNFSYTGSKQSITLPPGTYRLQCWGAQGGSSYNGIIGGRGGYSDGRLTLSTATMVYIYVGGQGSANSGGFNGGGGTTYYSHYSDGSETGYSYMGGGGGATDIRSADWTNGRMIVAGGGAGGAYCHSEVVTTQDVYDATALTWYDYYYAEHYLSGPTDVPCTPGVTYYATGSTGTSGKSPCFCWRDSSGNKISSTNDTWSATAPSGAAYLQMWIWDGNYQDGNPPYTPNISVYHTVTTTTTSYDSCEGGFGGGTSGGGMYAGEQDSYGVGQFGEAVDQTATDYRYCSGASGGGWYAGGGPFHTNDISGMSDNVKGSGGGSGWVNTSASAPYRPDNFNGLQLDSGTTYAGNTTFASPSGTNETGHAGDGYARITRV